jgi:hypothetical protein
MPIKQYFTKENITFPIPHHSHGISRVFEWQVNAYYTRSGVIWLFHFHAALASGAHGHLHLPNLMLQVVVLVEVDELEEVRVLVLDVRHLVGHFSFKQQVAQVSLL